ncbi:MAG: DUF2892 domain-containing protein [Myxococcota bacterium]|jgi:hypothetical protein
MDKLFPNNEGMADRVVRVVLGLVLISLVFVGPQTPFGWLGVILVATGAIGSCPLYRVFGINTAGSDSKKLSA